jgi:hypothetical protein
MALNLRELVDDEDGQPGQSASSGRRPADLVLATIADRAEVSRQ